MSAMPLEATTGRERFLEAVVRSLADPVFILDRDGRYLDAFGGAARREYDSLHFEACYYQGIEYCIKHGLKRFDPGAQGEHKIQRGFRPITTWSNHWIADSRLSAAVGDFTLREAQHNEIYRRSASELLPFK